MWKKEAGNTDVLISFFLLSPAHLRDAARKRRYVPSEGRIDPFACSLTCSFFFYVCMQIPALLPQLLLLYLQHATVSFDGTGRPATNQDKCFWLTQNHSADWGWRAGEMLIGGVKGRDSGSLFFMIGLKQWKFWSVKVKVLVWHSLNKYLLLVTEVTHTSSCRSHWAHNKT